MDPSDGIDQQSVGWAGRFSGKAWFTEDGGIGMIESFNQNCEHVPLGLVGGILPAKDPAFSLSHQLGERCGIHLLSGISHCSSIESRLQPDRHRIS